MNVLAHLAGQMSNQGGLPPSQNGPSAAQMQSFGVGPPTGVPPRNTFNNMDPDLFRTRIHIQDRIFGILLERQPQPISDIAKLRFKDIAKRLEEGLFKTAFSKDEYTNLDTLESRLHALIKRRAEQRPSLQQPASNSSMMMLTPSMSHNSMDSSMMAVSVAYQREGLLKISPLTEEVKNLEARFSELETMGGEEEEMEE